MNDMSVNPPDSPSVAAAVEKELRRRKQLLRLFTGLLLVPLLATVGFAMFGRSDVVMVQKEVQTQLAPVQGRLENLPDAEKLKQLQSQVSTFPAQIASVRDEVTRVDTLTQSRLENLPNIEQLKQLQAQVSSFPAQVASVRDAVSQVDSKVVVNAQRYDSEFRSVMDRQNKVDDTLNKLQIRLATVEKGMANEGRFTPKDVEAFRQKIQEQQKTIDGLQAQLVNLRRECVKLPDKPPGI
jgi:predicted  nucleic acid-binding Zn-ribbon protein